MSKDKKHLPQKYWIQIASLVVPIVVLGVALDQYVKYWATQSLKDRGIIDWIPGVLRLHYKLNDGSAFSMLEGQRTLFIVLTVIALAFVVYVIVRGLVQGWFGLTALALCISGTIGNFIDRVRTGYVVDMFEPTFIDFAIFNVADIFLTVSCVMLCIYILFIYGKGEKAAESAQKEDV